MPGTASAAGPSSPRSTSGAPNGPGAVLLRWWHLPLLVHALLLVAVLAAIAPFLHLQDTYTSDEGAYAIQVRDLDDGQWEYRYAAERYDPEGRWFPLANSSHSDRGWFAYVQHPAYPVTLLAATRVGGRVVGLHLPAMAGAVGVAVAAWLLMAEIEAAAWARRAAFWLAASGPVAIHAYILWAHTLSAAVAGLTLVAAVRLTRAVRPLPLAGLAVGSAAGVLLRSEGQLFAVALAGGIALVGLRGRPWLHRAGVAAVCLGSAALAAAAEHRWMAAVLGQTSPLRGARDRVAAPGATAPTGGGPADWLGGRIEGAFHTLVAGADAEPRETAIVLAALVMVGYASWCFRRRRAGWERDVTVGLVAAAGLYVVRALSSQSEAMTGLLAAWPLALIGLAALPRLAALPQPMARAMRLLIAVIGLLVVAVLATQYRIGGGLEWGGRFLSPALAPLAVVACVGLRRFVVDLSPSPRGRRLALVGALTALAVLPPAIGLVLLEDQRSLAGSLIDEVTTGGSQLIMTDEVPLPRAAWRTHPEVGWMLVPQGELGQAAARLHAGGARRVTALVPARIRRSDVAAFPSVKDVTGPVARSLGRRTLELSAP